MRISFIAVGKMAAPFKSKFAVSSKIDAFYTGGKVQISKDGKHMFCQCNEKVQIVDAQTGRVSQSITQADEEEITCFAVSPNDEILITAASNLLLQQWAWKEQNCKRMWKAIHRAPVASMAFDSTSTLLATGGSDSTIKIWDIIKQYCTHNLKGSHGVVSLLQYHPDISRLQLFSAADDYKIKVWDLQTSRCISSLESHFSAVTAFSFTDDGNTLLSSARDSVVVVWDLTSYTAKKTIPVYETIEGVLLLPSKMYSSLNVSDNDLHYITAGSKGLLRVWNSRSGQCVYTQENSVTKKSSAIGDGQPTTNIINLQMCEALDAIIVVTFDHNIILYKAERFELLKQFVGYNDEILDIKFMGEKETHIAVATNSEQIRIFELTTMNCQILTGHSDIVLSLDVFKDGLLLVSSSKDNTIRLWRMNCLNGQVHCIARGYGHTHAVGTVAISRLSPKFIVSGSQDNTLKVWNLPTAVQSEDSQVVALQVKLTEKAHDKDINSVAVSPNDKLIASGSQDRSAKLWNADTAALQGVFRGHRRGIWCVQFSPVDQVLATSSGDGSIRLWALVDFSCIKSFEGHDCSVLKVTFINRGMQLLSSGSDGLLKVWAIKNNECVNTFDEHNEKCWALVSKTTGDNIISGAADSTIFVWKDVTEVEKEEETIKQEQIILQEQELSNLLHQKKFLKAIGLAITLDQPFKVLHILKEILNEPKGIADLDMMIGKLREDQIVSMLGFAVQWSTNSKHCHSAQTVVKIVLQKIHPEDLIKYPNMKEQLEGFLPYTERHFQRMDGLLQQSMFVEYTWQKMRMVAWETNESQPISQETMDPTTKSAEGIKGLQRPKRESESKSEFDEDRSKMQTAVELQESNDEDSCESQNESETKGKGKTRNRRQTFLKRNAEMSEEKENLGSDDESGVKVVKENDTAGHLSTECNIGGSKSVHHMAVEKRKRKINVGSQVKRKMSIKIKKTK